MINRRQLVGGAATIAAIGAMPSLRARAQSATPEAGDAAPGFAIARVRTLPSAELAAANFPNVMANFLPKTREVEGYRGYVFATDETDPATNITLTLLADEAAVAGADAVAKEYVGGLDPRFTVVTPVAESGPVRVFGVTTRTRAELPPFLNGCYYTQRIRQNAPDANMDDVIAKVTDGLLPTLAAMDGFIAYLWFLIENGRTAITLWETAEQVAAGNTAIADWVAANTANSTTGDPVSNQGPIGYAEIAGLA